MIYDKYGRPLKYLHICTLCEDIIMGNGLKAHLIDCHGQHDLTHINRNTAYSRIRRLFKRYQA